MVSGDRSYDRIEERHERASDQAYSWTLPIRPRGTSATVSWPPCARSTRSFFAVSSKWTRLTSAARCAEWAAAIKGTRYCHRGRAACGQDSPSSNRARGQGDVATSSFATIRRPRRKRSTRMNFPPIGALGMPIRSMSRSITPRKSGSFRDVHTNGIESVWSLLKALHHRRLS